MDQDEKQDDQNQNNNVTLDKLQADFESAMAGWKRTAADFENFKRQKERENKELLAFAKEVTVVKLLPTIDTLEQALRHLPQMNHEAGSMNQDFEKQYQNWQTGVNGIVMQLDKALSELGVKKIEPKIGDIFDPNLHEAIQQWPGDPDNSIFKLVQNGYQLNDKVIRPALVEVKRHSPDYPIAKTINQ
jgi:molecular chaperone GrpE